MSQHFLQSLLLDGRSPDYVPPKDTSPKPETLDEREARLRAELRTSPDVWRQKEIYDELERIGFARGGAW